MRPATGVRAVALFEAGKGLLVLAAGFGLLHFMNRDYEALASRLVNHLHLNPAHRYPRIFLQAADSLTKPKLVVLAIGAAVYATVRFAEAYGLWSGRRWAEWVAALSAGIYIPFELRAVLAKPSRVALGALLINVLVVLLMARALRGPNRITLNGLSPRSAPPPRVPGP